MVTPPRVKPGASALAVVALVVALAAQLLAPSPADATVVPFPSRITVTGGSITAFDDEVLSRNDRTCRSTPNRQSGADNNDSLDTSARVAYYELRCGGEVRVEVRLSHNYYRDANLNGHWTVTMNVRLYEGTSDSTGDLDGQRTHTIEMRPNGTGWIWIRVVNGESRSDDYGEVRLDFAHSWD